MCSQKRTIKHVHPVYEYGYGNTKIVNAFIGYRYVCG